MKRFAILVTLVLGLAAPAFAQTASGPVYDVTYSDRSAPASSVLWGTGSASGATTSK